MRDYDTCSKTYVTLRIYPGNVNPDDVTARLGIEPSETQFEGSTVGPSKREARLHGWFLSSKKSVASADSEDHLRWLFSRILPIATRLDALRGEGARMDIACFWFSKYGHGGPTVSAATSANLSQLGIDLWFDIYFGGNDDGA